MPLPAPLVSAIITTHNRLPLLKLAIRSVQEQTYGNMELIVVDDGSTDGTDAYCQSQTLRYIYIPAEQSRGGNHARNVGVLAAKGKYVAFLDDDDTWVPEKTAKQVTLIEAEGCELVHCGWRMHTISATRESFHDELPPKWFTGDLHKKVLLRAHYPVTSKMLVLRQSIIDVGLFDEQLKASQEYELLIRLAQRGPICFVNEPLIIYRHDVNDKGRCAFKFQNWIDSVRYIYAKHKDLYATLTFKERLRERRAICFEINGRAHAAHLTGAKWRLFFAFIWMWSLMYRAQGYVLRRVKGA